jgi:predicted extracellular nuclease
MRKIIIAGLILLMIGIDLSAQKKENAFTVMFYNVENLFDTTDIPDFKDEEFTPKGKKEWDYNRYEKKLTDISRVILSIPEKELPAVIGFAEVENEKVLQDLIKTRGLGRKDYKALLIEGNDPRGIDCGLIYREDKFKYKSHELIHVEDLTGKEYILRGILHVSGIAPDGDPLHIFINHWKSRGGGQAKTEYLRIYAAIALRRQLDQLMSRESNPRYIIMGDFNDEPTNRSMTDILHAGNKRKNPWLTDSYNLFYDMHNTGNTGSYSYQGNWSMLDQIIISYNLINQDRNLTTSYESGRILDEEWMMYHNEKTDTRSPNRTYGGDNYYGGISDHLPVYVKFTW